VNTTAGWREMRLWVFAKRHRAGPAGRLPAPHVRVLAAGGGGCAQLGARWRRVGARRGRGGTGARAGIADGGKWVWARGEGRPPGAAGVLDYYHAAERLSQAGRELFGETAAAAAWAEARRGTLLAAGGAALLAELEAAGPGAAAAAEYFRPHAGHMDYPSRRA